MRGSRRCGSLHGRRAVTLNVAATYHLARRGRREDWRREQERPIVARSLTLSADVRDELWHSSVAKQDMGESAWAGSKAEQRWQKGWQLFTDLRYEVAQLDLLASRAVREAARQLVAAHQKEALRLVRVVGHESKEDYQLRQEIHDKLRRLEAALVEKTRADLGLGSVGSLPLQPPGSLVGKIIARFQR